MSKLIYILSGEINSGKTSALQKWSNNKNNVFGILTPKLANGRVFQNIATGDAFPMDAAVDEQATLVVGRFKFSAEAFAKASALLQTALHKRAGWLVVDEVGPLELRHAGFYEIIKSIIASTNDELKIILVVRCSLVNDVIAFFNIQNSCLITSTAELL